MKAGYQRRHIVVSRVHDHGRCIWKQTIQWDMPLYYGLIYICSSFSVFLHRLHEHYTMFVERLNCRYVFVDCLEKEGIITEEERIIIMEADGYVATRMYEDIPESCWPQMRDSEQMLMSNKKMLQCLPDKNYSQISKFLELMEENSLTHVLNYFVNDKGIIILQISWSVLFLIIPSYSCPWPFFPSFFMIDSTTWHIKKKMSFHVRCRFPMSH